jgi:nucleoid-associated protein YgaU
MRAPAGLAAAALLLALAAPADARERQHRVREGETAFTIAWRYAVAWEEIAARNRLDPGKPVRAGQDLRIPEPRPDDPLRLAGGGPGATRLCRRPAQARRHRHRGRHG